MKRTTEEIIIGGQELVITFNPCNRRTVSLRIVSSGELSVRFPSLLSRRKVLEFIRSKENWIKKNCAAVEASEVIGIGKGIVEGRILYFAGKPLRLSIEGEVVSIDDENISIPLNYKLVDMEEWYKEQSIKLVGSFINEYRDRLPAFTLKVKKQKNIWGSCNSKRRIYINSKIAMCRPEAMEYVMWHEICHLTHMNHSREFYELLGHHYPGYKKQKQWLKNHSRFLQL